jgi:ATP-binding cassette, subfamily B, bacterial
VRCFGLRAPLVAVAASSLSLRQRPWMAATRRFAVLIGASWVAFGIAYAGCVAWTLMEFRAGRLGLDSLTLVLLVGPQIVTTGQTISASVQMVANSLNTFGRYQWLRRFATTNSWSQSTAAPPDRLREGIRFEGVDFAYPGTEQEATPDLVLRDISLTLPAGRTIAFVGENGAGKSTLVKLLARMYDPVAGAVLVDGVPMSDLDPVAWRARISAGFQDFASLEFVLHESVSVGDLTRQGDRALVGRALSAGQADPVVAALDSGMDTQLGSSFEGGVGLSGGQWQRIALARAFMRERPLLMLLDEPTAALDPEAEQAIYQQYGATARKLARETGAVTVLVSHRFSTVRMADLIAVVAEGRIAEVGSHAELMRAGGAYAQLFELQAGAYR